MLNMRPGQPTYLEQSAHAFQALRKALTSLQHDYKTSQLAVRQPAFVPYPLQDVRLVSYSNITAEKSMYTTAKRMQHLLAWHSAICLAPQTVGVNVGCLHTTHVCFVCIL